MSNDDPPRESGAPEPETIRKYLEQSVPLQSAELPFAVSVMVSLMSLHKAVVAIGNRVSHEAEVVSAMQEAEANLSSLLAYLQRSAK